MRNNSCLKTVAIDLVPIRVGEGGAGSGIWTYARNLLHAMDGQIPDGCEILCLVNAGQVSYLNHFRKIRLICVPMGCKSILSRLFWVHVRLPLFCYFKKVDVLHKMATEIPLFCSAKRVTTIHDFYYEFLLENHARKDLRLYERLENIYFSFVTRWCFRKSAAIIAVSEVTRQEARLRYPATDRISVIHHGVPISFLNPDNERETNTNPLFVAPSSSSRADSFTILCVAKFMEHKGQHLLVKAFNVLLDKHPELRGHVCLELRGFHNDSVYFSRIIKSIESSPFGASIRLVGFDPAAQIPEIYCKADLVVLLSEYEGFGLPVLEAQSCGVPVLCSDLPVLDEVGGDGAIYVKRDDAPAVAGAMFRFIEDSDYYAQMQVRSFANVARFSWSEAARKTMNVYLRCC